MEEWLQASVRVAEEDGQIAQADVASGVEDTEILIVSYEDNTSQGKSWIFDSGSTVHVCSQKELFNNSLVAKEERIVKMVDGSTCEVIYTETVKITKKGGTVHGGGPVCPEGMV